MTRNSKIFCAILAIVLVFGAAVGGTLAYLMDKTDPITNTFTVGNIDITLTEDEGTNVANGKSFKMIPGETIDKEPTVTVEGGSEACWLFVQVTKTENLDDYIAYEIAEDEGWTELAGYTGVYYIEQSDLSGSDTDVSYSVLKDDVVTVKNVTKDAMDALEVEGAVLPALTFKAYACQSSGFNSADLAWEEVSK